MKTEQKRDYGQKPSCSVTVIHEDENCRETAVAFCDRLVERFWKGSEFRVDWWSFALLGKQESARQAAEAVKEADFVVFASISGKTVPFEVRAWIESWLPERGEREGTIVVLTGAVEPSGACEPHFYLRTVAHRAGMDYLTQVPQNIGHPMPDSLDSYSDRARQVTSVLDEILHHSPPPAHLRI